jgi:hypothetical protein
VSENAARIQLYTAPIATLIVKYLQFLPEIISWNFSNLIHLLRINWFTYRTASNPSSRTSAQNLGLDSFGHRVSSTPTMYRFIRSLIDPINQ